MHVLVEDAPKKVDPVKLKATKKRKKLILIASSIGFIICLCIGIYLMFLQPPPVAAQAVYTPPPDPTYKISTMYELGMNPGAFDQRVIKITHKGGDIVTNITKTLWITIYPPEGTPYVQRSLATFSSKYTSFEEGDELYVYYDMNQMPKSSKELPTYDSYMDFPDGKWEVHIDDARYKTPMSEYNFTIINSKTHLIMGESDIPLNKIIEGSQPYDTIILYGGENVYYEQLVINKPLRIIGMNNPTIDAGGAGSVLTVENTTDVLIQGLKLQNSGTIEPEDAGILIKGSTKIDVRNNTLSENQNGIYLYQSSECNVLDNYIYMNDISGIALGYNSNKNVIKYNVINLNTMGIYLQDGSDNNHIVSNVGGKNSRYGIFVTDKLRNIYEYNNFSTDTMSYDAHYDEAITLMYTDYSNDDLWGVVRINTSCIIWGTPGPSGKDYTDYSQCT